MTAAQTGEACECATCLPPTSQIRMIVCAVCGNKRCPHANDHRNACTGSNDPGQPGSGWAHVEPWLRPEKKQ
jgi:hypothetical protein